MNKDLIKVLYKISGNVLCIGLPSNLNIYLDKNEKIITCDILTNERKNIKSIKESIKHPFKSKSVNINKLRKKYKKKKIDYIICDYDTVKPYLKTFIKNSIYINKNKLYFYGNVDFELIKKRYSRYKTKIDFKKYSDGYIVEIDNSNAKNNKLKEFFYYIIDTTLNLVEIIGDILMG